MTTETKTEARPTAETWIADGRLVYALEAARDKSGRPVQRNRFSAGVQGGPDTPEAEMEANARLMAAAPDLHDALLAVAFEMFRERLMCRRCGEPADEHKPDRCEVAGALAKAATPPPEIEL